MTDFYHRTREFERSPGADPVDVIVQIRRRVETASPTEVFRAGEEASRIAASFPGSGMTAAEIARALISEAINRRLAVEMSSPTA